MRSLAFIVLACICGSVAHAQQQEDKLIDRVLKPDARLRNSAQDKQFVADGASVNKRAYVTAFYAPDKHLAKPFSGERSFMSKLFGTRQFSRGDASADLSTRTRSPSEGDAYRTPTARTSTARESGRPLGTADFAETKPFLGRRKSQKALHAHDTPMTVEQVRELLNKNK